MKQYNVTGMSCAACVARVEKAVNGVDGVEACAVNLLTNSMNVEGSASADEIIKAVEAAGYGASLKDDASDKISADELKDEETPKILKRLIISLIFLLPLMYISMGHMMWNFPVPKLLHKPVAMGIAQMIIALIVMVINRKFFINGIKGVIHKSPNMDTLVALGSGASFIYSVYVLAKGEMEFFFESAAMILVLITVGKTLESYSKGKTTNALKSLMSLAPETATVIYDGKEITVPAEKVKIGDIFMLRPGDKVAVDGVIIEGEGAFDESSLTGESIPADKQAGDSVYTATINKSGYLKCEATKVGKDTTLAKIIKMVSDASATKAPIAKIADKVSGIFVPVVIGIALVTFVIWLIAGQVFSFSLTRAIAVLVISCPCALGLATPVAIMVGNGVAARNGILFKNAASLEETGRVQIVALDKTGTITEGKPQITDIIPADGITENELIKYAYALESKSEHPLAGAVNTYAESNDIEKISTEKFAAKAGNGLTATVEGKEIIGGSLKYVSSVIDVDDETKEKAQKVSSEGKTPMLFALDNNLLGIIAVADTVKADSPEAISQLQNMGIKVVMLTGDNRKTAEAIAKETGVDFVISDVLPDGKADVIEALSEYGKVAMVGDGINDAPALTKADVGIAIGAGTDVAIDSADVVLMNSSISDVAAAIRLSRNVLLNIKENLFWAFIYNIIGIPLAAGMWMPIFGWTLKPVFGAAAMSLSSFCVVTNALRLNLVKVHSTKKDKIKNPAEINFALLQEKVYNEINKKENETMTKVFNVEGMMCPHCEARVKSALEGIAGVASAVPSHTENKVTVTLNADVADEVITAAITDAGYTVK